MCTIFINMNTIIILEGIALSFLLLISCVVGKANGAVNMVFLYEKEVQDRVVDLGLIDKDKIKRNKNNFMLFGMIPFFILLIVIVYVINGTRGFKEGFIQLLIILLIEGLFDRLFVDWYWVGKTKDWIIEGTEDLMPYIYGKTLVMKWLSVIVGYPLLAAIISGAMSLILK